MFRNHMFKDDFIDNFILYIYFYRDKENKIIIRCNSKNFLDTENGLIALYNPFIDVNKYDLRNTTKILSRALDFMPVLQEYDKIKSGSVYYTLSTHPQAILNWLGCFLDYCDRQIGRKVIHLIKGNPDDNTLFDPLQVYGDITIPLFSYLLALKKTDDPADIYTYAFEIIEKTFNHYLLNNNMGLIEHIEIERRCEFLYPDILKTIFNLTVDSQQKQTYLLSLGRNLIRSNQAEEFSFILRSLNYIARKKLYTPAMSVMAHDKKGRYHFSYTEWYLISTCELYLRKDRCLSIININKNKAYLKWYAEGKRFYDHYEEELKYLFRVLSLELRPDSDYRNELIFTEECTQKKLIPLGLHLTENSIKDLMYNQNSFRIFCNRETNNLSRPLNVTEFPDIKENIINHMLK